MSEWPEFDFDQVEVRARVEDPDTSHEAAALVTADQDKCSRSIDVVLSVLLKYGPGALSDFQIREHWDEYFQGEKWSEGLPRMARLWCERRELVEQSGEGIHNGRRCRLWKLTEKGLNRIA